MDGLEIILQRVCLQMFKEHLKENHHRITLEATGLKDLDDFQKLRVFLQGASLD